MFEQALAVIQKYNTIIIHRHSNPDGDALGSQIGLARILQRSFPGKTVYRVGDSPRRLSFMDGATMDCIPDSAFENALSVILDTADSALVSDSRYRLAAHTLRIDHHIPGKVIAQTEIINPERESCCGMIFDLAEEGGLQLDAEAARALYTGIVTDTGRFRYDCADARTFATAAKLLEFPVDTQALYTNLYSEDFRSVLNRAKFTLKIRFTAHNVAYIYSTRADVAESGLSANAVARGMIGTMADIRGVNVWVNFTEADDGIWCEIRSADKNVNPIAVRYGGGGHPKASGVTLPDRETAMKLLDELDRMEADFHGTEH